MYNIHATQLRFILLQLVIGVLLVGCATTPGMPGYNPNNDEHNRRFNRGHNFHLIKLSFRNVNSFSRPDTYFTKQQDDVARLRMKPSIKVVGHAKGTGGYNYLIGSQDILGIKIFGEEEVSTSERGASVTGYTVNNQGYIFFPFVGKILAKGRTTAQIRTELLPKLGKYLKDPQISVSIASYKSQHASISGQVSKAQVYPINGSALTVRDAIAGAGGLKQMSFKVKGLSRSKSRSHGNGVSYSISGSNDYQRIESPKRALLTRANGQRIIVDLEELLLKGNNSHNYVLWGGDALHIQRPEQLHSNTGLKTAQAEKLRKVFMMGELKSPGTIIMEDHGMTLAEALSDRGGFNEKTTNPRGVFVVRASSNSRGLPVIYQLTLQSIHSMILAEKFALHERDIVYITAAPVSRWSRVIQQVLPFLSTASSVERFVR